MITEQALQPIIVIRHTRQTFRPSRNEGFYFILDTQIDMWKVPDYLIFSPPSSHNRIYQFPYAVLEIKFDSNQPKYIDSIMNIQKPVSIFEINKINQCPDFSKYVYGVAAFFSLEALGLPVPSWPVLLESVADFQNSSNRYVNSL